MALSWNEIKDRAINFQQEWADVVKENAETQSFYNDFFNVFGMSRKRVAAFEAPVKKLGDKRGRIDLFWKGVLLVEQKSRGRDLDKAYDQALDYFPNLKEEELPRYIMICDFKNFEFYDLETNEEHKFKLSELHKNVSLFGFIAGYQKRIYKDLEPVNIEASELMGNLHDRLFEAGYTGKDLEHLLVRLLFCFFADDTGIFETDLFKYYIEEKTKEDGSDLGSQLMVLFQVLNTHASKRQKTMDEDLAKFPYINGELFTWNIQFPHFNKKMRDALLKCCYFNWSNISPVIFGSLFQVVADREKRRTFGEHYTEEKNILKTISSLFLDDLRAEFIKVKSNKKKLEEFHAKLGTLSFFDPACGCGNFLVVTYRELRLLEIEVLKTLHKKTENLLDISHLSKIDVDKFYGIEIDEFPAKIAGVALWLTDHQMNILLSETFGRYYNRIPLNKHATIVEGNALRIDWKTIIEPKNLSYILGNPPFVGSKYANKEQQLDKAIVFANIAGAGVLDYVACWYIKAAQYISGTKIKVGFVSTNSISQGEQVSILWNEMFNKYKVKIHFAHRTFAWTSEAKGKANVHCVIIGFACFDILEKRLFDYENPKALAHETKVQNINPYLLEGKDIVVAKRSKPICVVPEITFGNMPNDGGYLLFTNEEKEEFLQKEPLAEKFIKPLISSREFINGESRWCLWLEGVSPAEIKSLPMVLERVKKVKECRGKSTRATTRELANYPTLFGEIRQPKTDYVLIPLTSSERRIYIPMAFCSSENIPNNSCSIVPNATLYHFGVLTSTMHMCWVKYVCGRLKSDFRYSNTMVYNNFPWPSASPTQMKKIEAKAQAVLDARKEFEGSTLADLYDPNTTPPKLTKAHKALDKAVDELYGKTDFVNEKERMEFLFDLYAKITEPLGG